MKMVKTTYLEKLPMQKDNWNHEEENGKFFSGKWTALPKNAGLRKCGKSCRQKWAKNQKTDLRHESFSPQEEELIIKLHAAIGSRWPIIAQQLPGRTDNDVKTLWNTKLRKKLSAMGIDPVTHKPFSQILADYGNIGTFPKARMQFSTSSIMSKSEQPQKNIPQTCPNIPSKDHSLHLYSQFQAINWVTDSSNYTLSEMVPPESFMTECASSSTSPSSTANLAVSGFNWSDFLLQDAPGPVQENATILAQDHTKTEEKQDCEQDEEKKNDTFLENLTSSNGSFVEAMIASQDEMFLQFPTLYEEPFYYY